MNTFEKNYIEYIDSGIRNADSQLREFLINNKSNVSATLWGHGGIGKTACAQKICLELFHDKEQQFAYIIFVSAKDRLYNVITGKIQIINLLEEQRVKTFDDIIKAIGRPICRHLSAYEIRKRALINLVSYVSIEHLSHQSAIKAFEDFYISCLYMEMSVGEVLSNLKAI